MTLVLAQTMAGSIVLLFCTPLWNEVKRGFFKLTGWIIAALALATWAIARAACCDGGDGGAAGLIVACAMAIFVATLVWLVALQFRRLVAARIVGMVTVAMAVALLGFCAATAEEPGALALFQMVAAAAFLGGVLNGLLLGHWYLTDRGLSRKPINRYANALLVGVGLEAVAVMTMGFGPSADSATFNPLLTSAGLSSWIALGMVGATGLIAALVKATLRGTRASAVQSATGFFYLAVLTAFTAGLAAMVSFLPEA